MRTRLVVLAIALSACGDRTPARIDVAERELTINTTFARALGARLVNAKGEVLSRPRLSYSTTPSSTLAVTHGDSVTCLKSGTASVSISGGGKSTTVAVWCRLVKSFGWPEGVGLYVGGKSQPLAFAAYDEYGRLISNLRLPVIVRDTTVARLVDGLIEPRAVGRTSIDMHAGPDIRGSVPVWVADLEYERPFSLDAGGTLSWPLKPGQYGLDLKAEDARAQLVIAWAGTNCGAVRPGGERHLQCLVRPEAKSPTLYLRNMNAAPASGVIRLARGAAP